LHRPFVNACPNPGIYTELVVSYYSFHQIDQALAQYEVSLKIDTAQTKTLLNQGIVLAFGKQDLEAATKSWEKLVAIAPTSPEAARAKEALAAIKTAHPTTPGAPATGGGGPISSGPAGTGSAAGPPPPVPP